MIILHRTEPGRTVVVADDSPKESLAFAYPESSWLIDPDLTAVRGVEPRYWKVVGNLVVPMHGGEQVQADKDHLDQMKREALMILERSEARRRTFAWEGDSFRLEIGPLMVQMLADEAGWDASTCVSLADGRYTEIPREQFREFTECAFRHWQKWRERLIRTRDLIARATAISEMQNILETLQEGIL